MANQIQADYERLNQVALRFTRQAEKTQQLIQQVQKNMGRLQQSWEGVAASAFLSEMNGALLPGIKRLQQAFSQSAQTITRIATVMSEAEQTAAALFKASETTPTATTFSGYGGGYDDGGILANTLNSDSPSYDDQGDSPQASPELSPAQIESLAALGITIEDLAGATPDQIQHAIDFLSDTRSGNDTTGRISNPILDAGTYTGAELVEAVATLETLSSAGIEFGQSKYSSTTWSLEELQQASTSLEQMATNAATSYVELYGIEGLTTLASYYGLAPENAHYAPLMSLLGLEEGENFNIRRDSQDNVSYIKSEKGFDPEPRWMYRERGDSNGDGLIDDNDEWGQWQAYHPKDATYTESNTMDVSGPVVWYARYDGNAITFGNKAFDGENSTNFTDASLFAHEISHQLAETPGAHSNFSTAAEDNEYATGTGSNDGYENHPRTSESGAERVSDLLANGLLGTFTDDEAGAERQGDYQAVLEGIFTHNNYVPEDFATPSDEYSQAVQDAMEDAGIWTPPAEIPSASAAGAFMPYMMQ